MNVKGRCEDKFLKVKELFNDLHDTDREIGSSFAVYKDGEPIHIQDPQDVPPATCNKICLHFAHLTKDCDCECEGLWTGSPKPFWGEACERCPKNVPPKSMAQFLGTGLAECSGIGNCKNLKCECPEGFSGDACEIKDAMATCSISNMGEMLAVGGTPLHFSQTGEYKLFKAQATTNKVVEEINGLRMNLEGTNDGTSGFSGIAIKSNEETIVILGRKNLEDPTDLKPRILVNCQEKKVASAYETKNGATIENTGTSYMIITAQGTQVRVMVFAVGKEQFVNGVILAKRSKKPLEKGIEGACAASKTSATNLKAYGLTNGKFSLFSCPSITNENRQQRQPRFRALVAQTTKVNIDKSTSGIMFDEVIDENKAKALVNGLGRFAVMSTPKVCHRPENKVRECCSRVADGQEWKSKTSKPSNLEKEAFVACARSFCRKTTCTMAITMGRIPVSLKAEAQDELIDEKKEMLSEIKRFSRETVTKKILVQREKENPSGC